MSVIKVLFVTLLAGTLSISVALFGQRWMDDHPNFALMSGTERQRAMVLPDLRLTDIHGNEIGSHNWAGKVLIMHFWASWCAPCLSQIGSLERLQVAHDTSVLQVASIAIDTPKDISTFLASRPLNYQILFGGLPEIELAARFGNRTRSLPFTLMFDRTGRAVFSQAGLIDEDRLKLEVEALLPPLLPEGSSTGGVRANQKIADTRRFL
ncbi:Cytochrome c biogenesis protein TlpA [Thiorhodovibrio winogradskyi]|uniref:Cytochrome c biogenesis protein TlpA n=1 Tax=Thiorhodovibrio winogradskyi TaxID=77007 RepID=A0ABZ0S8P0_9GAMM|nr:TlpA disulfide reductase family protein [Thiorhodovibrio winogradskyi]